MTVKKIWLDRNVHPLGPYLALCMTQAEYDAAMKHLKKPTEKPFVSNDKDGTMHTFKNGKDACCIVCIDVSESTPLPDVLGLIVHEAVHVWQEHKRKISEFDAGEEQEAYGVGYIALSLFGEYFRRKGIKE